MQIDIVTRLSNRLRAILLVAFAMLPSAVQANLVQNSSFESPSPAGSTIRYNTPGTPPGFFWTVGGAGVDLVGTYWTAEDGSQSLDLNQDIGHPTSTLTPPGSVSQDLATDPGTVYLVEFWIAGNPDTSAPDDTGPPIKTMDVFFGATMHSYSFDVTGHTLAELGWTHKQFLATATGSVTTLSFVSTSSGYAGMILDNVSVSASAVPEPSTLAIMLMGVLTLLVLKRAGLVQSQYCGLTNFARNLLGP